MDLKEKAKIFAINAPQFDIFDLNTLAFCNIAHAFDPPSSDGEFY